LHDAAGLLIALWIIVTALQAAKAGERRVQELATVQHRRLPAHRDGVPTEQSGVERDSRLRREPLVLGSLQQSERPEIIGRL